MEGGLSLAGNALADHEGLAGGHPLRDFRVGEQGAAAVMLMDGHTVADGDLLLVGLFAEAAVGRALFDQQLRIFSVQVPALGLDVRAYGAAHIRTLVMNKRKFSVMTVGFTVLIILAVALLMV